MKEDQDRSDLVDTGSLNLAWGRFAVECLHRYGLRHVVVSPGSRSTPLTWAFAAHDSIRAEVVLDERSAGFVALGLARRSGAPVALVCTSGTAVANYLPAVIEASESGVPLLLITADRPPEQRHCAAGQTIDQVKIFGHYVRRQQELPLPEAAPRVMSAVRNAFQAAFEACHYPHPGPVHLNAPFREPLHAREEPDVGTFHQWNALLPTRPSKLDRSIRISAPDVVGNGLIVVGHSVTQDNAEAAELLLRLSAGKGWPVLGDALGRLRHLPAGDSNAVVVAHYDSILRSSGAREHLKPDFVIQIGDLPTSKELRASLTQWDVETWLVSRVPGDRNASGTRLRYLQAGEQELVASLGEILPADHSYSRLWQDVDRLCRSRLQEAFKGLRQLTPPRVVWELAERLPEKSEVFVASSLPVRDTEWFWPVNGRRHMFMANRGANGIDGTLSTALGSAMAADPLAFHACLIGDLALLHDATALQLAGRLQRERRFPRGYLILCFNNGGGGIFELLPIARHDPPFEQFFATPQPVDLQKLAQAHGLDYTRIDSLNGIKGLSKEEPGSIRLVEFVSDRKADATWRRSIFKSIVQDMDFYFEEL